MNHVAAPLNVRSRRPRIARHARRGLSMMLVLISLGTATILTTAYISSHDTSAMVGENVASASEARWCATSGIDLGVAVLETETNWRTSHNNGILLEDYVLGSATLDVFVEDAETGAPPTGTTRAVKLTSIATSNGVSQAASVLAIIEPGGEGQGVDVDLSEFAVFTSGNALFKDTATLTRWPKAPSTALGARVNIGTRSNIAASIALQNNAAAIDATVYHGPGASSSLIVRESGPSVQVAAKLDNIPLPDAPTPPTTAAANVGELKMSNSKTLAGDAKYSKMEITSNTGRLNLNGNVTIVSLDDLRLKNNSGIIVDGDVKIVVADELRVEEFAFIELKPNATLTMYVQGAVTIDDGYVGAFRTDRSVRDTTGDLPYMSPDRIRIFGGTSNANFSVAGTSVLNASVYGPKFAVSLLGTSALYGRVASRQITVGGQASIFYDEALDSGGGYTDDASKLYDGDGRLKAGVSTLVSLDASALQSLADVLAAPISFLFGLLNPAGGGGGGGAAVGPGDPTPRTITVTRFISVDGQDFTHWENNADGAVVLVRTPEEEKMLLNSQAPGDIALTP